MSATRLQSPPDPNENGGRKRVGKACDRCRLKKSKCDGECPCSRCMSDDVICVFGERKKAHDKTYPKGYVELLEHQQTQLVSGLQEMYRMSIRGDIWPGQPLQDTSSGRPLTHDILERLGALNRGEGASNSRFSRFEDDLESAQAQLQEAEQQEAEQQREPEQQPEPEQQQQQGDLEMQRDPSDCPSHGTSPSSSRRMSTEEDLLFDTDNFLSTQYRPHPVPAPGQQTVSLQQLQQQYSRQLQEHHTQQSTTGQTVFFPQMTTSRNEDVVAPQHLQQWGMDEMSDHLAAFDQQVESIHRQYTRQGTMPGFACLPVQEYNDEDFNMFVNSTPNGSARV
ncbi:Fluconazole resistance protein 1 [Microsporum canis]|uniref:Zn(2)-C6 fungal-type domain-containing protein n=1 Tax=Arthroderma otae (strain ATCC MYA-4605 / CBS 113480) TaxID=554155 RepID=C5FZX7_ARTOC|nr:conserved hypothetical protein [Microsporum canis CBS 113480]EEQ35430.1 conserved hypothetical protein [Microsporum canis CBS 113480]